MRLMAEQENGRYQCFLLEEEEIDAAITVVGVDREAFDTLSPERQQEVFDFAHVILQNPEFELFALVDTQEDKLVGRGMIDYKSEELPEITALHIIPEARGERLVNILYDACALSMQEQNVPQAMVRITSGNDASFRAAMRNGFEQFTPDTGVDPDLAIYRFLKRDLAAPAPKTHLTEDIDENSTLDRLDHAGL